MSLSGEEGRFKMSDGFGIFYRRWRAAGKPERALVCLHGLPGESSQFDLLGKALAGEGDEVYAVDIRGLGNSVEPGLVRGDVSDSKRQRADVGEIVAAVRDNHPGTKVFLLGHSIGCDFVVWHAATARDLGGLVLLAPGVRLTSKQPSMDLLPLLLSMMLSPRSPYDLARTFSPGVRDSEELRVLLQNPLVTTKYSARFLGGLRPVITGVLGKAKTVDRPSLVVQGDADVWVKPEGAKELTDALASKDKSLRSIPGAGHFLFGSLLPPLAGVSDTSKREEVFSTISEWLSDH